MNINPPPPPSRRPPSPQKTARPGAPPKRPAPSDGAAGRGRRPRQEDDRTADLMARAARALPEAVPARELAHGQPAYFVGDEEESEGG